MPLYRRGWAWTLSALAASGCSSGPALAGPPAGGLPSPAPAPAFPAQCVIGAGSASRTSVAVAALGPHDSALVLRQRFFPPVLLDCAGDLHPAAARAWSADSSGHAWTLLLAEPGPDAADVISAWRDPAAAATLRAAGVSALIPLDRKRLVLQFDRRYDAVPPVLADSTLALRRDPTGPFLTLAPLPTGGDPRDALDAGADLLRSSDPEVLAYARADSGLAVVPLPWSRTYVLLGPASDDLGLPPDSAGFRAALARDAVAGEARAGEPPYWWEDQAVAGCAPASGAGAWRGGGNAIGYDAGDAVAAALAARLVALSGQLGLSARGLSAAGLDSALGTGALRGVVLALPRRALVPCRETARWPRNAAVRPLVETRSSAVVRRGLPPLAVEWDGTIRPVQSP